MLKVNRQRSAGQALLLVLVAVAVILTIALSSVSRSVIDVSVTSREEESLRAFSAAEAGVEQSLYQGGPVSDTFTENQSAFDTVVGDLALSSQEYNVPGNAFSGDMSTVWFVGHNDDGTLECGSGTCYAANPASMEICFGEPGTAPDDSEAPALELSVYYDNSGSNFLTSGDSSSVRTLKQAYDPNWARRPNNNFSAASVSCSGDINGKSYAFSTGTIDLSSIGCTPTAGCLLNARMRLLYNTNSSHPVGVKVSGGSLPSQGKIIESTGTAGDSTRKVQVSRTFGEVPSIFEAAVFSLPGIYQQQ